MSQNQAVLTHSAFAAAAFWYSKRRRHSGENKEFHWKSAVTDDSQDYHLFFSSPWNLCLFFSIIFCFLVPSFSFVFDFFFLFFSFLDAPSHLYKRVCPSVGPFVRPSVTPSLRRLLGAEYSALLPLWDTKPLRTTLRLHVPEISVWRIFQRLPLR